MELIVGGVLPAEEIAREFESADVLLFVRDAITLQRGSAIAGIACRNSHRRIPGRDESAVRSNKQAWNGRRGRIAMLWFGDLFAF